MNATTRHLGSTPVSGVGESVPLSQDCPDVEDIHYAKRCLPHFERPWTIYAVTVSTRARRFLSPEARTIVLNALLHFRCDRYELFAACVMPDHVHFLLQPWPREQNGSEQGFWRLSEIAHSVKSFTAHQINKLEQISGPVWEEEFFDRYIRSESDLREKFEYICRNPWQSGIVGSTEDYRWLWTLQDDPGSGSTPVPGVGEDVSPARTVPPKQSSESSRKRDASAHARDGRAPQTT